MIEITPGKIKYIKSSNSELLKIPGSEKKGSYYRIAYCDYYLKLLGDSKNFTLNNKARKKYYEISKKFEKAKKIKNSKKFEIKDFDYLYDFQTRNVKFMIDMKKTIQASEMGSGKTLMAIATAEILNIKKVLIISPGFLKLNWFNELDKFLGSKNNINLISGEKDERLEKINNLKRYNIVNYAMLTIDHYIEKLKSIDWDFIIADEAHYLKNRNSQRTKGIKKLKHDYITLMTGTPLTNHPVDLYSLLNILYPYQFRSYWRFVETFCETADSLYKQYGKDIIGLKNIKQLKELIQPIMIREIKKDILPDLPEKRYQTIELELDKFSKEKYIQFDNELVMDFENDYIFAFNQLIKNIRLRQFLLSPKILFKDFNKISVKTKAIKEIINSTENKIIIFTSSKKYAKLLAEKLNTLAYHGDFSHEERENIINKFKSDSQEKVMVLTYQAGSTGLNLQFANITIYADKMYDLKMIKQAENRTHRIGQKDSPLYISLVTKNTIEEDIENKLWKKEKLIKKVIK